MTKGLVRYTLEELRKLPDETDWARLDAMTDDEIEAAAASDPDWAPFMDIDWSKAEIMQPVGKQPISIRLDQDVLDFFKTGGAGYQRRINAVLRAYMGEAVKGGGSKLGKRRTG
jgi:uncharacterized protein (DUF4415 family)